MNDRDRAFAHFKRVDPTLYRALLPHRASLSENLISGTTKSKLFERLCRTVVSQQLGTAAAASIWKRVQTACGTVSSERVLKISPVKLRSCGLSNAKAKTLKAIAGAVRNGSLDLLALKRIPESEASEMLTRVWGVGPWTAEMFLMFALGRADVFSAGDLGLIRAVEAIYGLPKNESKEAILKLSETWSPHRTYAALALWRSRDSK